MAKRLLAKSFLSLVLFLAMAGLSWSEDSEPAVPAVYIFGDSTFDVGTNNFLPTKPKARADRKFYGIDFPKSEPTGRFSNGYNTADSIVMLLGFDLSPPPFFLLQNDTDHFKSRILKGANFASGGSGILDQTGANLTRVISMREQVEQFTMVRGNISEYIGDAAEARMNKALFLFSVGSNDIIEFGIATQMNAGDAQVQQFLDNLLSTYETHLKNIVKLGGRKFGILSAPPLGCIPVMRVLNATNFGCMNWLNMVAQMYEGGLEDMLQNLTSPDLPDLKYSLAKSYELTFDMIDNPRPFGLREVKSACCGNSSATLRAEIDCGPDTELCENRRQFLFWDEFHPTSAASKLAALTIVTGGTEYVTPTNFTLLVLPS